MGELETMQEYDIKRGHFAKIDGDKLEIMMTEIFGSTSKRDDGFYVTSFGALAELHIKIKDKGALLVETVMDPKVDQSLASETIKKYNQFLERATGLTSKERSKRLQKKAKDGKM